MASISQIHCSHETAFIFSAAATLSHSSTFLSQTQTCRKSLFQFTYATTPKNNSAITMRLKQSMKEKGYSVVTPGESQWVDSIFAGGFPGGEQGLYQWLASGALGDVPEVADEFQPRNEQNKPNDNTKERICCPYLGYCWEVDWMEEPQNIYK